MLGDQHASGGMAPPRVRGPVGRAVGGCADKRLDTGLDRLLVPPAGGLPVIAGSRSRRRRRETRARASDLRCRRSRASAPAPRRGAAEPFRSAVSTSSSALGVRLLDVAHRTAPQLRRTPRPPSRRRVRAAAARARLRASGGRAPHATGVGGERIEPPAHGEERLGREKLVFELRLGDDEQLGGLEALLVEHRAQVAACRFFRVRRDAVEDDGQGGPATRARAGTPTERRPRSGLPSSRTATRRRQRATGRRARGSR